MAGMRKSAVVTLSGSQKQRTAIAATLAMQPRILVLDEPLSDLDPVGAQEVLATLQRLARDGQTGVIVIEHRFGFRFRAKPKDPVLEVPEAIEFFGFRGREDDSPWELSQGGRQRLPPPAVMRRRGGRRPEPLG
jgi:ABC-type nitrate/sulfonate/bicarbonate transport system ATPase subunit